MMRTILKRAACGGFVALLLTVPAQMLVPFVELQPLNGVTTDKQERPRLSLSSWFDRSFQSSYQRWLDARVGFRPLFVRVANQVDFSVFRDTASCRKGEGTGIIVGSDNWLYQEMMVHCVWGPDDLSPGVFDQRAADLAALQRFLNGQGTALACVVAPSKPAVYPEYVPQRYLGWRQPDVPSRHERMVTALRAHNVPHVDGLDLFLREKARLATPMFPRGGAHWTYHGAYLVLEQLFDVADPQLPHPLPRPSSVETVVGPPEGTDRDLADLLNILRPSVTDTPTARVQLEPPDHDPADLPKVLISGDSFAWTLTHLLHEGGLSREIYVCYYDNSHVNRMPRSTKVPVGNSPEAWRAFLADIDLVIVETTQAFLPKLGYGFLARALEAFGGGKAQGHKGTEAQSAP